MSFEIISAVYPPNNDIQVLQPQYSAQHLGDRISIGEKQNVSLNLLHTKVNFFEQFQFNSKILSEENLPNHGITTKLEKINQKNSKIDSISTDIKIGSIKSELEFNSQDIQNEMTLLSGVGFDLKVKKELEIENFKPKIQPILSFEKSFDLFEESSNIKGKKKASSQQTMRFGIPKKIRLNSPYLKSLEIDRSVRINQNKEIDDYSKDMADLTKSLNSLRTTKFGTSDIEFSVEADLEDFSAKFEFPLFKIMNDELELKFKTNLPEIMIDDKDLKNNMKSTLSLKYAIDINNAGKLELQSSYSLRTNNYKIMLMTIIE